MAFWKTRSRKRSIEDIRGAIATEIVELQLEIVRLLDPDAPFSVPLRETSFLASAVIGAIISTTPGRTPDEKNTDLQALMDILIRAVDQGIEEAPQDEQDEFKELFQERWNAYLPPAAYLLGEPDAYADLDKPLFLLLADRMGFEPLMVETIQTEVQLGALIRQTADRVWPVLKV